MLCIWSQFSKLSNLCLSFLRYSLCLMFFLTEKTTPKAPETPTQVTRSGRAVKANRRFIDDMETGSSDEEEVRFDYRATFCCIR